MGRSERSVRGGRVPPDPAAGSFGLHQILLHSGVIWILRKSREVVVAICAALFLATVAFVGRRTSGPLRDLRIHSVDRVADGPEFGGTMDARGGRMMI